MFLFSMCLFMCFNLVRELSQVSTNVTMVFHVLMRSLVLEQSIGWGKHTISKITLELGISVVTYICGQCNLSAFQTFCYTHDRGMNKICKHAFFVIRSSRSCYASKNQVAVCRVIVNWIFCITVNIHLDSSNEWIHLVIRGALSEFSASDFIAWVLLSNGCSLFSSDLLSPLSLDLFSLSGCEWFSEWFLSECISLSSSNLFSSNGLSLKLSWSNGSKPEILLSPSLCQRIPVPATCNSSISVDLLTSGLPSGLIFLYTPSPHKDSLIRQS